MERSAIRDSSCEQRNSPGFRFAPSGLRLTDHMSALRMAFRIARHERPFTIEAVVVVPEHLHVVWTLLYIPRHAPIVSRD
jgi:hypothetical protein